MAFVLKVFTFKNWHLPIWERVWTFHCESIYSKFLIYMCHHEDYITLHYETCTYVYSLSLILSLLLSSTIVGRVNSSRGCGFICQRLHLYLTLKS